MGKTKALALCLLLDTEKRNASTDPKVLRTTQHRTKLQLTSPKNSLCGKQIQSTPYQETDPVLHPHENVMHDSNACLDCQGDLNNLVEAEVRLLFPDFFAPDARTRLDQNTELVDERKHTDPIVSSWLRMFGARRLSVGNV